MAIDVEHLVTQLCALYPERLVRDPTSRHFTFKTRNTGKITLAVASWLYRRYPVGRHLESVWLESAVAHPETTRATRQLPRRPRATALAPLVRRRDWYVVAAGGGSLHREHTHHFMSKKETHHFLTVPYDVGFDEAIVFALARSSTDDLGLCSRLCKSKLAQRPLIVDAMTQAPARAQALFWKDAIRFFCANPVPIQRINDLVDYLDHAREANVDYALKGRTIASLGAAMGQWHRDLTRVRRLGDHTWDGAALPDSEYIKVVSAGGKHADWVFTQVKNSRDLAEEGNEMHHCVYSYQSLCIDGRTSIWSLRTRHTGAGAVYRRRITFEIAVAGRRIVQVRGFANRRADPDEVAILARWAGEHGVAYDPQRS